MDLIIDMLPSELMERLTAPAMLTSLMLGSFGVRNLCVVYQ